MHNIFVTLMFQSLCYTFIISLLYLFLIRCDDAGIIISYLFTPLLHVLHPCDALYCIFVQGKQNFYFTTLI